MVDPTANVIALTNAAVQRQDDLREADCQLNRVRIECVKEIGELRAKHAEQIRELDTKRLDSIRQVDVLAVNTAADRALAAIQTLAATTTANADTLRAMVATTATTIAKQTSDTVQAITERIAALEKSSYEGKGRTALSDPQLVEALAEIKALREQRQTATGQTAGISATGAALAVVITILIAAAGVIIAFMKS